MKLSRDLNISGLALDKHQLEEHLKKIASNHILSRKSDSKTFPIPNVRNDFRFITEVYDILNKHIKLGIAIHPAGEWLLDNYYIIEETVNGLLKELTLKKYKNLIGLENEAYKGFARVYVLASEIVAYTDNKINENNLRELLIAYQDKKSLSMEELWSIKLFFQIAIVKNIKQICEKVYYSQKQKYKVESIVERLIENKDKKDQIYKYGSESNEKTMFNEMKYPFIEHMSYKLKKYGRQSYNYLKILEEEVEKAGNTVSDVIKKEHFEMAIQKVSMGNCIRTLKELLRMDFTEIFESINDVEDILRKDPAKVYEKMDYKTRINYRNVIKEISSKTKISESYISKKALELAVQNNIEGDKKSHIGYYLISDGINELYKQLGIKKDYNSDEYKSRIYIAGIICTSAVITAVLVVLITTLLFSYNRYVLISIIPIISILIYVLVYEILTKLVQYTLCKTITPRLIPKLDMSNGLKKEQATMVVIPTIVKSKEKVIEIFKKLEIYYLANKTPNMYFTLLGDCSSSQKELESFDKEVIEAGEEAILNLNKKYKENIFHFLYRKRKWNEKESQYLGWERKRGLLTEFNEFLLDNTKNDFRYNSLANAKEENLASEKENSKDINSVKTSEIKYIITLDSDTELVLNTGLELVGAMSHILNKPIVDEEKNIVISGYGIMQPRVATNLNASRKSNFTKIFAGLGGTDMYTNAMSDVYQDNFSQGIFTGKGIYDLRTFSKILKNAIPENRVLSHDLLEGNYLRCGLVTDIVLIDGYPSKYNSFTSRQHRWIRGDWQVLKWVKKAVETKEKLEIKNPLNELSKFKILDNIMRSLLPIMTFLGIIIYVLIYWQANINTWPLLLVAITAQVIPAVIDILNYIIFKKEVGDECEVARKKLLQSYNRNIC